MIALHKARTNKILKQYFRKQRYGGSAAKEKAPNFGAFCYAAGYVGQLRSAWMRMPIHRCGLNPCACLMHICHCYGDLQSLPPALMCHLDGKHSVLGILLSSVNCTPWMMRRCIDSWEFERAIPGIYDVMPGSRRNKNSMVYAKRALDIELLTATAHPNHSLPCFNAD